MSQARTKNAGDAEQAALQHKLGMDMVNHLCSLHQAGRLYDINNDMVRKALDGILATSQQYAAATGEDMQLVVDGHSLFVNRELIRPSFAEYRRAQQLREVWDQFNIGQISLSKDLTPADLKIFAAALFSTLNGNSGTQALFAGSPEGIHLSATHGESRLGELRLPSTTAVRVFCSLMALTETLEQRLRSGEPLPMRQIRRMLQAMVDLLASQNRCLFALCQAPDLRSGLAGHLVSTAVLAMAVGRKLGLSPRKCLSLGIAALFHDLPKAGLKDEALNQLEQPTEVVGEDRARVELHWLNVLRRVVELGSIGEAQLARLVAIYEAQLEFNRQHLYGSDMAKLGFYSRIIWACDLYDTFAWQRPGKRERTAHYAMMTLLQTAAAGGVELPIASVLLSLLGLYPVGSPVVLSTGEVGVVLTAVDSLEEPAVRLTLDAAGGRLDGPDIDLAKDDSRSILWPLALKGLGLNPVSCLC